MDGENLKVANGSSSTDGDVLSDGINSLEKPRQVQYFDVEDDEELTTPKETDGSEDTIKALDEEIQGLQRSPSEMQCRMEEMLEKTERSEAYSRSLESDKTILEDRIRDLKAQISDFELKISKTVSDALNKEAVINSMKEELNIEREKAIDAVREKDEEIVSLKKELGAVTLNEVEIKSLKEELKTAREKAMDEIDTLKEKLRLARDNGKEQLEMEKKKAAAAIAEKEEVVLLKQELLLAREELEAKNREVVGDKEAEIFLVKERLSQAMVDSRMREENLESEIKLLKDMNSELEGKIKGIQFEFDSDVAVQSSRGIDLTDRETEAKCSKVSWITTAAVAASSGTVAAAVTAFCLHRNRQN